VIAWACPATTSLGSATGKTGEIGEDERLEERVFYFQEYQKKYKTSCALTTVLCGRPMLWYSLLGALGEEGPNKSVPCVFWEGGARSSRKLGTNVRCKRTD